MIHTTTTRRMRRLGAGATLAMALLAAGCADDGADDARSGDESSMTTQAPASGGDASMDDDMTTTTMGSDPADMADGPSGPLCSAVPADGEGSFNGMTDDPAATAASNNPVLSTLVAAVTKAGLVDTLNSDGPFTIFAPANPAFEAIPPADLEAVLANPEQLTSILTLHVVAGERLSSADLAKQSSVATVNGAEISLATASDGTLRVNDQATVGCADIQTANATVHVIDAVLMP